MLRLSSLLSGLPVLLASLMLGSQLSCAQNSNEKMEATDANYLRFEQDIPKILERHGINTAGFGIIKNANLEWTGYFGEQAPGVPASSKTLFNVASITKTITTEAILRLVSEGKISLDEPMSEYWIDPDLVDDERHIKLTPRVSLTHRTGFLNWRYQDENGILRFVNEPDSIFGYSGEGIEYLMRFAGKKLGVGAERLIVETVFEPIGIEQASMSVRKSTFPDMARSLDEEGVFPGHHCRPGGNCRREGTYYASDDLVISVEEHAKFLIAAMNGDGLTDEVIADRNRVQTVKPPERQNVICETDLDLGQECPEKQGYGLGWEILDYGDYQVVSHSGSDWAELTLSLFETGSKDGLIIFLNGPNSQAVYAMHELLQLVDPSSPMIGGYSRWIDYMENQ